MRGRDGERGAHCHSFTFCFLRILSTSNMSASFLITSSGSFLFSLRSLFSLYILPRRGPRRGRMSRENAEQREAEPESDGP